MFSQRFVEAATTLRWAVTWTLGVITAWVLVEAVNLSWVKVSAERDHVTYVNKWTGTVCRHFIPHPNHTGVETNVRCSR